MKYLTSALVLGLAIAAGCKRKEATAPAQAPAAAAAFEFTVHKKGDSLEFKSSQGTGWKDASYVCKAGACTFTLDDSGVNSRASSPAFSISFDVNAKGVDMTAAGGASWKTLSYGCPTGDCVFLVNSKGVSGAR